MGMIAFHCERCGSFLHTAYWSGFDEETRFDGECSDVEYCFDVLRKRVTYLEKRLDALDGKGVFDGHETEE